MLKSTKISESILTFAGTTTGVSVLLLIVVIVVKPAGAMVI